MPSTTPNTLYARAFDAFRQGRLEEARRVLEALVRLAPGHEGGWNLAGVVCNIRRDFTAAIGCFERAIALGAGAGTLANLGFAHQALGQHDQAQAAYARALAVDPGLAFAWQKQAGLHEAQGRLVEALASYRRAVELDPTDLKSLGEALFLRRHLADWDPAQGPGPDDLLAAYAAAPRSDFPPLLLLALAEARPEAVRAAARKFAHSQWAPALAAPPLAAEAASAAGRPLRIGYLSSDFRHHAVAFLVLDVIAAHDRQAVEVFLYSHGPATTDPWRQAAIAAADHFLDVEPLDDAAAARRIARDRIDVLVDLNGYTQNGRPGINALRPAPVIASWLGYIGTLGEPRLADYVIGDALATPLDRASQFSEALALMPRCFQPNGTLVPLPPPPKRASQGLPEAGVVFCSFNQTFKLHPELWNDWCAILRAVPGSVLWLAPPRQDHACRNLRAEASRRGIDPARIVFAQRQPRDAHLARLALADIALDTWPYNSGTTASDALRAGVPLLTFPGEAFVGTMAASLLRAAGLPECVGRDRAGLVALATRLGNDAPLRQDLRARLQASLPASALFRPDLFARNLERLLAAMHAQALAGGRGPIVLDAAGALAVDL